MKPKTKAEARDILRKAFAALTPHHKENLRWHAANGTKIACGASAQEYISPDGYG